MEVINGPHKGKQGEVVSVVREQNKLIIENINMVRFSCHVCASSVQVLTLCLCLLLQHHRYVKSTPVAAGRSYLSPGPIHYSNVNLVDPSIG